MFAIKTKSFIAGVALTGVLALSMHSVSAFAADKSGSFTSHKSYKVSGKATVSEDGTIRLSGFSTTSGPDLYVYVGNGSPSTLVAKLKRNSGSQTYKIPAALAKSISTVHIHCKRFSSVFGTARVR